jgi:hypothetical protein
MREFISENSTPLILVPVIATMIIMVVSRIIKPVKWKRILYYGSYAAIMTYICLFSLIAGIPIGLLILMILGMSFTFFAVWSRYKFCDACGALNGPDPSASITEIFEPPKKCLNCKAKFN